MKKYVMVQDDKIDVECVCGNKKAVHTLFRIKATMDFGNVHTGDLGGYIEKEENLSHDGLCWVGDNAMVYGDAMVGMDAKVFDYSRVYGNAVICGSAIISYWSQVFDNAHVSGNSHVMCYSMVFGNADIHGKSIIMDNAMVFGDAEINGGVIKDNAAIFGCSDIRNGVVISNDSRINNMVFVKPIIIKSTSSKLVVEENLDYENIN